MKKFCIPLFIYLSLLISFRADAQLQYKWITGGGSITNTTPIYDDMEKTAFMCTDDNRNVYMISAVGSVNIRTDTFLLPMAYNFGYESADNVLVASYSCDGRLRWAKVIDAAQNASATGFVYSHGSVYLSGCLNDYNKHIGDDTVITSQYLTDYVMRIDTTGSLKWVRFVGKDTIGNELLTGQYPQNYFYNNLAADKQGNLHYCDYLKTGVRIMPGVTSVTGSYDLVYDSTGNMLSAARLDIDSADFVTEMIVSKSSNTLYVNRYHTDSVYFGGYWVYGTSNSWIQALMPDGTTLWVDTVRWPVGVGDIKYDGTGSIYAVVEGCCGAPILVGGDSLFETAEFGYSTAIVRMDTFGHVTKHMDIDFSANGNLTNLCILPDGKLACTGIIIYGASYMGDTLVYMDSGQRPIIAIFDTSGTLDYWHYLHGDGFYNWGINIVSNAMGDVFLGGMVSDSLLLPNGMYFVSTGGNTDFFIAKYGYNCDCAAGSIPSAHFTSTGTLTKTFTYDGTGLADSVVWDFGDSTASLTATSPTHAYTVNGVYHVCVTVYSGCGTSKWCTDISTSPTAVPCVAGNSGINIFPNPATNQITISGMHNVSQIELFNAAGICVQKQNVTSASATLNIASLAPGTWLIMIRNEDGTYITRIFTKY